MILKIRRGVEESGLLFQRSIVVTGAQELRNPFKSEENFLSQTESLLLSGNQKKWIKLVKEAGLFVEEKKKLKVEAQERWHNFGRENLNEMQKCIAITSDYFAKDDLFISRCHTSVVSLNNI